MTKHFITGTGLLPSPAEAVRYGVSPDDHRKTRNALKAIRKQRRNPKPKGPRTDLPLDYFEQDMTISACSSDGRAAPVQGRAAGSIPAGPTDKIRCTRGVTHAAGRGDFNDRNTVNSEAAAAAATIRRQLAALDARPADGIDEKDAVRAKLLARLRELEENHVRHQPGRAMTG